MVSPPPGSVLRGERSVHGLGQAPREGKTKAEAIGVVCVAEPLEGLEDPLPVLGRRTVTLGNQGGRAQLVADGAACVAQKPAAFS